MYVKQHVGRIEEHHKARRDRGPGRSLDPPVKVEDENGIERKVHYLNPKPANFEDAEKLVVEGSMKGDVFVADYILVKCPSKYNDTNVMGDEVPATS